MFPRRIILFLPNYPVLHGNEFIFTISSANCKKYIDNEIEYLVKGLHIIEEQYKIHSGNTFGFGSPSPPVNFIQYLAKDNIELSKKLKLWIANNGGNYYIPKDRIKNKTNGNL
jgi:hypothetical protein